MRFTFSKLFAPKLFATLLLVATTRIPYSHELCPAKIQPVLVYLCWLDALGVR